MDGRTYGRTFEPHIDITRSTLRSRPKNSKQHITRLFNKMLKLFFPILIDFPIVSVTF